MGNRLSGQFPKALTKIITLANLYVKSLLNDLMTYNYSNNWST